MTIESQPKYLPLVTLVIPVFNEESNIEPLHTEIARIAGALANEYRFEFLFTDNCSTDRTFELLLERSETDHRIRVLRFSRNFGFQRSILTGYTNARGEAAIQLDADLQDPPSLIPQMLEKWRLGYDVVYGVRRKRAENPALLAARNLFYRLVDSMSEHGAPRGAGDFRLVSRRVLDVLTKIEGSVPYIRGTISEIGFKQVGIVYDRDPRRAGASKFSLGKLVSFALDAIINQSTLPLRISGYVAALIGLLSVLAIFVYGALYLINGSSWPTGFATLALLVLVSMFINSLFFAVIGAYIGQMYLQAKGLPISIIDQTIDHNKDIKP